MSEPADRGTPESERPDVERVVARLRPHGRAMFWPSLCLVAVAGATGYFAGGFPEEWQNLLTVVVAILVIVVGWLVPLLLWLGRRYIITTRRIVMRHGLFVRTRQELLHSRGYDVTVRKTTLQSSVGSGDVMINTGLDRPVVLRDIPRADLVQRSLHDLMERATNPIAARRQAERSAPVDETNVWGSR